MSLYEELGPCAFSIAVAGHIQTTAYLERTNFEFETASRKALDGALGILFGYILQSASIGRVAGCLLRKSSRIEFFCDLAHNIDR